MLGFDPDQTFEVADDVLAHTRSAVDRGRAAETEWQERLRRVGRALPPSAPRCSSG